jgi:capsular polysaccharide biosynthesis protein
MLSLILIFATITGLAAHYSLLCMAATYEGSRRLIVREEDGAELWIGEVLQL